MRREREAALLTRFLPSICASHFSATRAEEAAALLPVQGLLVVGDLVERRDAEFLGLQQVDEPRRLRRQPPVRLEAVVAQALCLDEGQD